MKKPGLTIEERVDMGISALAEFTAESNKRRAAIGRKVLYQKRAKETGNDAWSVKADAQPDAPTTIRFDDHVKDLIGLPSSQFQRARIVVLAARRNPSRFKDVLVKMNRSGNITGAFREVQQRLAEDEKREAGTRGSRKFLYGAREQAHAVRALGVLEAVIEGLAKVEAVWFGDREYAASVLRRGRKACADKLRQLEGIDERGPDSPEGDQAAREGDGAAGEPAGDRPADPAVDPPGVR